MEKENYRLLPPGKIGVIGGGQLGRMLAFEAKRMGYRVIVLDENPNSPAGQVADKQIVGSVLDPIQIRKLAQATDVLTYEFESINADFLCELESDGYKIYPSGKTLKKIQNKYNQKKLLHNFGLPVPRFRKVNSIKDINESIGEFGLPIVLKSCTGGYDGKGNYIIKKENDINEITSTIDFAKHEFMVEEFVKFEKEISIVVARSVDKEIKYFNIAENIHKNSILKTTRVPANIDEHIEEEVKSIANKILELFDDVGVFCIEFFKMKNDQIYINEIAPRPHNSGHYTIESCVTSQFEQQLRAITGLPLGSTRLLSPTVMVNLLGKDDISGRFTVANLEELLKLEEVHFHLYGKEVVSFEKKIGHITSLDKTVEKAEEKANLALNLLEIKGEV